MLQIYNFFLNEKEFKGKICFPQGLWEYQSDLGFMKKDKAQHAPLQHAPFEECEFGEGR